MYKEEIILNITAIENLTVYVISGFDKSKAITTHVVTSKSDMDLAVYNKTFIYAVPIEGTTNNLLQFNLIQNVHIEKVVDKTEERILISVGITFCGLGIFIIVSVAYIVVKKVRFMIHGKTKIDVAPKTEKSIYDLTKQEDDLENETMRDVDIDFDDNMNHTAGTPKMSEEEIE